MPAFFKKSISLGTVHGDEEVRDVFINLALFTEPADDTIFVVRLKTFEPGTNSIGLPESNKCGNSHICSWTREHSL